MALIARLSSAIGVARSLYLLSSVLSSPSLLAACRASAAASMGMLVQAASAPPSHAPVRGYKTMTKRRRKEIRKAKSSETRDLLAFAKCFDPVRTSKLQVKHTLSKMGYDFRVDETVAEDLSIDFTLVDWYCGLELVEGRHFVLPTDPNASSDMGLGPDVRPEVNQPGTKRIVLPHEQGFPAAPPEWLNPVRGLMLNKETAARHAAIRAKGWKLVCLPQPLWEFAAGKPHDAGFSRRDLLLSMLIPIAPFEARPVATTAQASGGASAATEKARSRSSKLSERDTAVEAVSRATLSARGAEEVAEQLSKAEEESATGRSRKARRVARLKVSATVDAADARS